MTHLSRLTRAVVRHLPVLLATLAYASTVLLANALIQHFGMVDVLPGPAVLIAPAGVYAVGLSLVTRDVVHELGGARLALLAILIGVALSTLVADPRLVVASGLAFALSELLDLAVYVPLRRRGWTLAALGSSAVGLVVDSVIFLWLAFGSLTFLPGQVVGKAFSVLAAVAAISLARLLLRRPGRRVVVRYRRPA